MHITMSEIARIIHEVMRAHDASQGAAMAPAWDDLDDSRQAAAVAMAESHMTDPDAEPAKGDIHAHVAAAVARAVRDANA